MSAPNSHRRLSACGSLLLLALSPAALRGQLATMSTPPAATALPPALPAAPPPLRLVVNVPAFRLDVYEHGALAASYPVTVGLPHEPTPTGTFRLQKVVWNPWWHPPYNRRPKDKVTPPGPRNPMGKVKLYFANLYYLHGTPKENEIGTPSSRGCVRLRNEDAVALAGLVHRHAVAPLPAGKLEELAGTRTWRTQTYTLQTPVPLDIVYDLVEVRDGELRVYRDFYRDARFPLPELAVRALEAAGYARDQVDAESLTAALDAATQPAAEKPKGRRSAPAPRPEPLRVPVEQLVHGAAVVAAAGGASAER